MSKKADGENCVTANECLGNICENWKCNGACIDNDEDDYGLYCEKGDDCNDNDKLINPGMTEVCNLVDDDCNNQINEGFKYNVYYKDKDSDGYGSKDVYENYYFCSEFGDFVVTNHDDCNDNDKLINPSADEICGNEVDENCDGKVKIECPPIVCSDGTFPEECSKNKPGYCTADAKLTADCYKCGCPEGQQCKGSGGGYCMPQCSDGTGLVKCSEKNKGKYCQRQEDESKNVFGELIDDCVACGCPSSVLTLVCNKDTKICEEGCNDEALIGECSIKTASARCSPPNKDIYDPHLSWDCSCCPGGYRCAGEGNFMCIKESCSDGIQNQDETGIDCGGVCPAGCTECLGEPLTSYYEYPDWNIDSSVKDVALEALKEYANYKQVSVDTLDTADEYMEAVSYYLYENGQYMSSHFPNPSDAWIYLNEDSYYAYLDNHKWFGMQNAKLTITESGLRAGCTEKYCGDCDDRSMLYASLLRAIGVNPECVYIATSGVQPGGKSGSSDPVFDHFFNIILYKNKYRIIDVGLPFKNNFFCPKYNIFCWESKYVTKNVYNDKTENTYWEFISALSQTELPGKYTWNYPNSEIKCPADEWKYWTYYADEDKCP